MRNQYPLTIAIVVAIIGSGVPALADSFTELGQPKTTAKWQNDAVKRMPPDVVIDNTSSTKQSVLEKQPVQQEFVSRVGFKGLRQVPFR